MTPDLKPVPCSVCGKLRRVIHNMYGAGVEWCPDHPPDFFEKSLDFRDEV